MFTASLSKPWLLLLMTLAASGWSAPIAAREAAQDARTPRAGAQPGQANAKEAARLGVDKLFGSTRLRDFGGSPAFTPDGKYVVGFTGRGFKFIDVETAAVHVVQMAPPRVNGRFALSPDGQKMLISGASVAVWNVNSGDFRFSEELVGDWIQAEAIAWAPDSVHVLTGHYDGQINIWNVESGQKIASHQRGVAGQFGFIDEAAWSPENKYYACGGLGGDQPIAVFDAVTHQKISSIDLQLQRNIRSPLAGVEFLSETELLTCSAQEVQQNGVAVIETSLKVWDVTTGKLSRSFQLPDGKDEPEAICLMPDRRQVAVKAKDVVRFYDVSTGAMTRELPPLPPNDTGYGRISISPDGEKLAYGGEALTLVDIKTGGLIHAGDEVGHFGDLSYSLSPDSKTLATRGHDGKVIFWDVESCWPVATFQLRLPMTGCGMAWAPDGSRFYTLSQFARPDDHDSNEPLVLTAFDPVNKLQVFESEFPIRRRRMGGRAVISPDGRQLAIYSPGEIGLAGEAVTPAIVDFVEATTGRAIRQLEIPELGECQYFRYSPDGKFLLTTHFDGGERFKIWDAETGEYVYGERGLDRGLVKFSRDGGMLVGKTDDGEVVVYDTVARREIRRINPPGMRAGAVNITPDGKRITAALHERGEVNGEQQVIRREVRIWDVATGEFLHKITHRQLQNTSLLFSDDGEYVFISTFSGAFGIPVAWELEKLLEPPD